MRKLELEKKISKKFQREYCILVGSATTALTFLLEHLTKSTGLLTIFPATSCLVAFSSASYAGVKPLFVDIQLDDFTIDMKKLEETLIQNPMARIVVVTHIFGHLCNIPELRRLTEKYGLIVIEDSAQSSGAVFEQQLSGSFSHASVISFGHTKILEAGHGGAILTDDKSIYESVNKRTKSWPVEVTQDTLTLKNKFLNNYRDEYYKAIKGGYAWDLSNKENLLNLQKEYESCFILPYDESYNEIIFKLVDQLELIVEKRQKQAAYYDRYLDSSKITKPRPRPGSVCWRYTFLDSDMSRDLTLNNLRSKNIHCSSWYPLYPRLYTDKLLPNGLQLEKRVINLWVDGTYNEDQIENICYVINSK